MTGDHEDLQLRIDETPDAALLGVRGQLTVRSAAVELRPVLRKLVLDRGRLLVDLDGLTLLSSSALTVFPSVLAAAGGWPTARMVLFGARAPKLQPLLFMQENQRAVRFDDVFGELGPTADNCIGRLREEYDMSEAEAKLLFENVWIYTFGVGALCATRMCRFSEETLGQMLSTEFQAMLRFVKAGAEESHERR